MAVGVVIVLLAPLTAVSIPDDGAAGADRTAAQAAEPVDSCRTIDEPGTYELVSDIDAPDDESCIRVDASDVVLDGNGHVLAGGNASGAGVAVFGGDVAPADSADPDPENVTVRNLTAVNWTNGVAVGSLDAGGSDVRVTDVTLRDNRAAGLWLAESETLTVRDVTATANGDGVALWEVQNATLANVTAADNDDHGVALLEVSGRNALRNVTAVDNGGRSERGAGVYLSTDTWDNVVVGADVRDNRGPGVQFSDSFRNELRDSVVAGNDGAGVVGVPSYEDALRNVTVVDNGGPAVAHDHAGSQFAADDLHLGAGASVSFDPEPVAVQRANAAELPDPPRPLASDVGVALAGVEDGVTATVAVDDPAASSLWRYDGSDWQRVAEVDTDDDEAGAVSGTVTGDGTVVALAEPADQDDRQSGGGDETTDDDQRDGSTGNGGGAESVGDGTFVVQSTASDDFGYLFVVDGSVEGTETGNVAADSGDTVVEAGDGTVTVVGSTGSNAGDAFEVDGDVVEFYTPAPDDEYVLELDGEDVTDQIPEPSEHEDEEDDQ